MIGGIDSNWHEYCCLNVITSPLPKAKGSRKFLVPVPLTNNFSWIREYTAMGICLTSFVLILGFLEQGRWIRLNSKPRNQTMKVFPRIDLTKGEHIGTLTKRGKCFLRLFGLKLASGLIGLFGI